MATKTYKAIHPGHRIYNPNGVNWTLPAGEFEVDDPAYQKQLDKSASVICVSDAKAKKAEAAKGGGK